MGVGGIQIDEGALLFLGGLLGMLFDFGCFSFEKRFCVFKEHASAVQITLERSFRKEGRKIAFENDPVEHVYHVPY